ncbi:MAG TPA: 50S ribosomal protein L10 [Caldithrix abyssi]|uniref:Large ribosomal subunit protein uL10 n=1 Tax=Caldithrix abyssi TaxID=187145 RepID=A0A7V1PU01_CALAY|nr:50S ribosomal protein L10 [Caldithrix abyssi]
MPTEQKRKIVAEYTEKFKEAKAVYIADYTGIDVATVTEVRNKFREQNAEYKVLKNRLAKRSFNAAGITELDEHLKGVNAYIIGYDDPVAPAKIFEEINKKNEVLKLHAVLFEGQVFGGEDAKEIAKLPTRDALLGQFVGMISSPMSKLAATLQAPMQKLAGVLDALKENKE